MNVMNVPPSVCVGFPPMPTEILVNDAPKLADNAGRKFVARTTVSAADRRQTSFPFDDADLAGNMAASLRAYFG